MRGLFLLGEKDYKYKFSSTKELFFQHNYRTPASAANGCPVKRKHSYSASQPLSCSPWLQIFVLFLTVTLISPLSPRPHKTKQNKKLKKKIRKGGKIYSQGKGMSL